MERNIIIDYLNISSVIKLIKNERGSNVSALFRPKSKLLEVSLINIIRLFGIRYSLDKMSIGKLSENIANDIFDRNKNVVRAISNEYIYNSSSKVNDCLNFSLNNWLFDTLWRQVSIIEYVRKSNMNVDAIYISTQVNKKVLIKSSFYQSELNKGFLIHYKSSSLIDDKRYAYVRKGPRVKYVGKIISTLIEMLYALLYVRFRRKTPNFSIDLLIFSQFPEKWLGLEKINDDSALNSKIVYPNGIVGSDKDAFHIRSIYWNDIFSFYAHMVSGIFKFFWAININVDLFSKLLTKWKFVYILQSLYNKYNIRIVLSGFESPISRLATSIASDNIEMASFDCLWSLGERPMEFATTQHKLSDRFFLWGEWHHDLMCASHDKSSGHIIAGYIGDHRISLMKTEGEKFRDKQLKKYSKIITVFDSGASEDCHFPEDVYIEYVKAIMLIAVEFNALVVLKIKKEVNERYADIIKSNDDGRLIIHNEKGSLVSALNSDVVIGVATSSPASISAVHGKQVILYDPNKQVWDKWESYTNSPPLIRSLPDMQKILRSLLSSDDGKVDFFPKYIDPYGDGKAQHRMESYIQNVFYNLHLGKNKAMHITDDIYKKQWGNDKVIIKENLNKGLNEKNNI
jgi:hypothetical protein